MLYKILDKTPRQGDAKLVTKVLDVPTDSPVDTSTILYRITDIDWDMTPSDVLPRDTMCSIEREQIDGLTLDEIESVLVDRISDVFGFAINNLVYEEIAQESV